MAWWPQHTHRHHCSSKMVQIYTGGEGGGGGNYLINFASHNNRLGLNAVWQCSKIEHVLAQHTPFVYTGNFVFFCGSKKSACVGMGEVEGMTHLFVCQSVGQVWSIDTGPVVPRWAQPTRVPKPQVSAVCFRKARCGQVALQAESAGMMRETIYCETRYALNSHTIQRASFTAKHVTPFPVNPV